MDNPQLLVSTAWLAAHLDDKNMRVVDIRGHVLPATQPPPHYFNHYADYIESHLPNAVFVDWVQEITDPTDPRHARIAPPERFSGVMQRLGLGPSTQVVAYDDANGMFAARLWWALNYYGHAQVAVLDGGWQKWLAEGRPTTSDMPSIAPTNIKAIPNPAWIYTDAEILATLDSNTTILLDVRSEGEYAGQASRATRAGHIPGAINLPRSQFLNADGTMLPPEQLHQQFIKIGITDPSQNIVTYCNGGVSASYGLLALRLAGFSNIALYDGSWKAWGNDDSKPIV